MTLRNLSTPARHSGELIREQSPVSGWRDFGVRPPVEVSTSVTGDEAVGMSGRGLAKHGPLRAKT